MRPQSKPFAVERKRSRKPLSRRQPLLKLEGSNLDDSSRRLPITFAEADRVFGNFGDGADRSDYAAALASTGPSLGATATRDEVCPNRSLEPPQSGNRILPDLSPHEWMVDRKSNEDAPSVAIAQRSGRQYWDGTDLKTRPRGQNKRSKRARKPEPPAPPAHIEQRIDEQPVLDSVAGPDGKAAAKPSRKRGPGTAEWPNMSPREIRRAAARGAFKIAPSWNRRRLRG